ncbi:MAG: PAS domain S-box protein [Flavobacteriales bacterium]|nr:PAS domain S-box protein [Flavobacteriales bacterium]
MKKHLQTWIDNSSEAQIVFDVNVSKPKVINRSAEWFIHVLFGLNKEDDSIELPQEIIEFAHQSYQEFNTTPFNYTKLKNGLELGVSSFFCEDHLCLITLRMAGLSFPGRQALMVFENNVAGIYETNINGQLLAFNKAFSDLLGYTTKELLHKKGNDLYVHTEDRLEFLEALSKERKLINWEMRYQRKDESVAWCIENAFISEQNGQESIVGTIVDITEQKNNKDRFESLFYSSPDALLLVVDDVTTRVNKRAQEIFGYSDSELLALDVFHPKKGLFQLSSDECALFQHKLNKLKNGKSAKMRFLSRRKDKSLFYSEVTITHSDLGNQRIKQVIVRDVSERVLYEESIKESETRFKLLSDVAIEGIVFSLDEKIRDCNKQFVHLFGYKSTEEILGRGMEDFISRKDLQALEKMVVSDNKSRKEIWSRNKEGKVLILEARGSKIEYQQMEMNVYLFYDITSRKRTEQALEQSTERFKSLVENSPNGIFILIDGRIQYVNNSGVKLLKYEDEDDVYDQPFSAYFEESIQEELQEDLDKVREGEEVEYKEYKIIDSKGKRLEVGLKPTLTVYDNKPSVQVTLNNLSIRMKLMQETMRAQIAEEINVVLKREIEEHKLTQQKLREVENFRRNIIQSSIDMIIAVDEEHCITEFNPAAQEQFGYSFEEVQGKPLSILYKTQKEYKKVESLINKSLSFSGEIVNITKSGKKFTSLLSASVIRDEEDQVVGSMGVSRDITEIKKSEQKLRDSEERYRDLFENASDFIFSVDTEGKFKYANKAFLRTLGYAKKDLPKLKLDQVVIDSDLKLNKPLDSFAGRTLELEFKSKKGDIINVYGDSSVKEKEGKPDRVRAIFRDITDLKAHENSALEQGAKLESIFNSTENMMIWTMNLDGCLTSSNKNFRMWASVDLDAAIKEKDAILDLLSNNVNSDVYQNSLNDFNTAFKGIATQFELPLLTVGGSELWLQVFVNPVYINEEMKEVSCLAYDITDRKEIDRRILDSLKEKEVLLQEVHHRVKNNLQVISSILNLQSSFVDDEKTLAILDESQSRIKTMSYIHESLYQTSDFSSIEFTEYISTLASNLIQSYGSKDCVVHLKTDFDEIYLNLDQAIPCGLIINELVSNAMKYAYEGKSEGILGLSIKEKEGVINLQVTDNGVGMPEDYNPEESDSLGIYLVYALVEQLDATIQIKNENGTRFLLTFEKQ